MIVINNLAMAYSNKILFYDVNLNLNQGMRYALIGANGTGKSTFFNLLNSVEEPVSGSIQSPKNATFGWLKQDQFLYEDVKIRDIVLQGKQKLWQAYQEQEKIYSSDLWDEKTGIRAAEIEQVIADNGGYTAESEVEAILSGLGVPNFDKPLKTLSGGYKLRVLLAQTLYKSPDVLLLDEPTNHLDIVSIRWLEQFLCNQFSGLVVFISHDLDFINNISDKILDLDFGEIRQYSGNYKKFLFEKALLEEQRGLEMKSIEDKIARLQKFVDKNSARASKATQARSRRNMIERIKIPDVKKSSRMTPNFSFDFVKNTGRTVLRVQDLEKSYSTRIIFSKLSFTLLKGEKLAIVGANGIGKSTLIKSLLGELTTDSGEREWDKSAEVCYLSQDHHDSIKTSMSVLEWLHQYGNKQNEQKMRQTLSRMLFTHDDIDKDVKKLSGGEAARLLLARVMLAKANVIILDEPTNHMDIETIESLCEALHNFAGSLIFVSHNRHFVNKIADKILYLQHDKSARIYSGSFQDKIFNS